MTCRSYAGVVGSFDVESGLGSVRDADGTEHPFHCTEIIDGTRNIAPGTAVRYHLAPGHLGRFEAAGIDATGIDAAGIDAAGIDAAGIDAAGIDAGGRAPR
jgi:hypothetical protein